MGSLRSSRSSVLHFAVAVLFGRMIYADESFECRDLGCPLPLSNPIHPTRTHDTNQIEITIES